MAFKNQLSVIPHNGAFAIAIDGVATGQVYSFKERANEELKKLRDERKAKRETPKTK